MHEPVECREASLVVRKLALFDPRKLSSFVFVHDSSMLAKLVVQLNHGRDVLNKYAILSGHPISG